MLKCKIGRLKLYFDLPKSEWASMQEIVEESDMKVGKKSRKKIFSYFNLSEIENHKGYPLLIKKILQSFKII